MNFQQRLGGLKVVIDKELERYFDILIAETKEKDILIAEALVHVKKIALSGGKRIRGALLVQTYLGVGGKEKKKILKAAAAIELVHLSLLVHDDIIDRGDLRHGQLTLHEMFAKKYQKKYTKDEARHLGESMAIIVGQSLLVLANRIILETGFAANELSRALLKLQDVVATTIVGQSQDIAIEYNKKSSQKAVFAMYENKTARYTFEGPMFVGAMLAGCGDKKSLSSFTRFALPIGISFQIQDDILGVFGNEKKIGKSVASDVEEGKQSILVIKARESLSATQRKQFEGILGKKNISKDEIMIFQGILKSTGALEYSKKLAHDFIQKAKAELEKMIIKKDAKDFLTGLVEYLDGREI